MSTEKSSRDDVAAETARLDAMLAGKGLTPDQVATLMRDEVQPVLADAVRRVEAGAKVNEIEFGLRPSPLPDDAS